MAYRFLQFRKTLHLAIKITYSQSIWLFQVPGNNFSKKEKYFDRYRGHVRVYREDIW